MMLVLFILSSADQKKKKKQHSITFQPYREHICPYKYFGDRPLGKPSSPFDDHKRHGHDIFDRNLKEKFGPVHRQFVRFPGRISFRLFFFFFWFPQSSKCSYTFECIKCNSNGINEAAKMTREKNTRVSTSEKAKKRNQI